MKTKVWVCSLLLAVFAFAAPAGAAQVKICHVPPGNPSNFHTITVNDSAVQAHLGHGDLLGACFEHCDQLCDDGNACTIDACDAAEHCVAEHPPVSCDDGNLCTIDSCDPAAGCSSTPQVCQDGANCTVDTCDPLTGQCAFPPVSCPSGQECNAGTGSCESTVSCPCVDQVSNFAAILEGAFGLTSCTVNTIPGFQEQVSLRTSNPSISAGAVAFSTFGFGFCATQTASLRITFEEAEQCQALLRQAAAAAGLTCGPPPPPVG